MIRKKFIISSFIYTFSSTLSTAAGFLLLPFYTNSKLLAVGDFGALSLYIGFSLLVQIIASFSIDYYVVIAYHELKEKPQELKEKIASLNGYIIAAGIIIILLFYLGGDFIIKKYIENPGATSFRYMMMSVVTGIFSAHFRFYNNLLIQLERPWRYLWSNMLNFVSTVVISLVILHYYPLTLEGPMWGRLLSCLCIFILSFGEITYLYGISFEAKFLKPVMAFCLPLMITAVFQWVLSYSDRYIIKPILFNSQVAIFDLAVRCTVIVGFLLDGLSSAMSPKIYSLLKESNSEQNVGELNKQYSGFNVVMLLVVPVTIIIIPIILPFFISDGRYLQAFLYFGIICAGFFLRGIQNLFIYPLYYFKKTPRLIPITGIAAFFQIGVGYFMVKHFSLPGAAVTLNIVKIILIGLYFYYCRDLLGKNLNLTKMIWLPLAAFVITCIPEFFIHSYGIQMHEVHIIEAVLVFIPTYYVYRNEIQDVLKWAKKLVAG